MGVDTVEYHYAKMARVDRGTSVDSTPSNEVLYIIYDKNTIYLWLHSESH